MSEHNPSLKRLAEMAEARPGLMSGLLMLFRRQESMDEEQLAAFLECDRGDLPRLALCRRPRPAPRFRRDIEEIAAYAGADPTRLAKLVRAAEVGEALRGTPAEVRRPPMLLAARDHEPPQVEAEQVAEDAEGAEDDSR